MKYIISILIIVMASAIVYNVPKPAEVQGENEKNTIDPDSVMIIYEVAEKEIKDRDIKQEIQHVFGSDWKIPYAIMMSESRGKANAKNVNKHKNGSVTTDFGYWQINDHFHPDVKYECAIDIQCSTAYAYKLSKGGTDWSAWYGWKNKSYLKFM